MSRDQGSQDEPETAPLEEQLKSMARVILRETAELDVHFRRSGLEAPIALADIQAQASSLLAALDRLGTVGGDQPNRKR